MKKRKAGIPKRKSPARKSFKGPNPAANAVTAKFNMALAMHQQGNLNQAKALYEEILQAYPRHFDALHLLGVIAAQTKNFAKAVELIGCAIEINPNNTMTYLNHGKALLDLKRPNEALASFERAIKLDPTLAEAYLNRGNALQDLKRLGEALDSYNQATKLQPNNPAPYNNRARTLQNLGRPEEALASFDQAIKLNPSYAEAYSNRGIALHDLKRLDEALDSLKRAINLNPYLAEAYFARGDVLMELKRLDEALASYERAIRLNPDYDYLYGSFIHAKIKLCDWHDLADHITKLQGKILRNEKATMPFPLLAITDSLPLCRKAAEIYVNDKYLQDIELTNTPKYSGHQKIRLGYFSADYHYHATSYLMAELFESHNRDRFELVAFSFGPDKQDDMRKRVSAAFDQFIDVRNQSDQDIAQLSRSLEIDIAVDLKGFTNGHRFGIFPCRPAPVLVNYLGYPGTLAAEYFDYLIADKTLIPQESRPHYAEKIVYLPDSYQVNDSKRSIADKVFTREELGLKSSSFVFCCFNSNYKITPDTFEGWMRILNKVDESVLWLLEDNPTVAGNLRREAEARGVRADRLVFAGKMPIEEHLARHRAADLFIDTLPYNAHTTASDALWAGLPVLTCAGQTFAARVAASLLNAIHLPELITTTQEEYEALAIELATNPEKLKQIRQKLAGNRLTTPLFDVKLFTGHIENAYTQMYERYQADLPPDHIFV